MARAQTGDHKKMSMDDFISRSGGPRFFSPLPQIPGEASGRAAIHERPLLVFLPGIDGTGVNALRQFHYLAPKFELRSLNIPNTDRTPFSELVEEVVQYLEVECSSLPNTRPVYLLGESFGGILALAVALRCPTIVHRVVLVNPATSYPRSVWPNVGPLLPELPDAIYTQILPLAVSPLVSNPVAMAQDGLGEEANPLAQMQQLGEKMMAMTPALQKLADILPKDTLTWKLQLLGEGAAQRVLPKDKATLHWKLQLMGAGAAQVVPELGKVRQKVLVVAGTADRLIPSEEEAGILERAIPRCSSVLVQGSSHAMLMEQPVNLMEIMESAGFYTSLLNMTSYPATSSARAGVAGPMEVPSQREVERSAQGGIDNFTRLTSPVFLSTRASDGKPVLGLEGFPDARPVLLVGNHQTFAPDLPLLVKGVLEETGVLVRGLAHPAAFGGGPGCAPGRV